ncbi:MAG: 16S rRNA (cytidine(1402)-2'-O)-methyltransferase [Erysipelotrichaceae bacterium]
MKTQKSFDNDRPTCYLVATPIGNLNEMTPRAIEILKQVDVIAAEDTRNTMKLLAHFGIETRMISHHEHNETASANGILQLLEAGQNVALVSDAGYPLISDPGEILVKKIVEAGFNVVPISGSSAALNALVASGLSPQPFVFYGFLPVSDKECRAQLNQLKAYPYTLIFYEAPHRIQKTLKKIHEVFGDRNACIAREVTKRYEEFLRGTLSELIEASEELRGEIVLVVEGNKEEHTPDVDLSEVNEMITSYITNGISASQAIRKVSEETGIPKNELYAHYHQKEQS